MTSIQSALAAIARFGIGDTVPIELPEPEHHAALVTELQTHRLLGVAVTAVESDMLPLTEAAQEQLRIAHDIVMAQTLRVELMLLRSTEVLADAGVPFRVLKGAALAHGVASRSSEREYRDVDLLIPSERIDQAVEAIVAAGGARLAPELRSGFDRRFGKSVTMRFAGVEIDLHRTLCPGPFGALMFPHDLFVMRDMVEVGGRALPTLDRTDHLLHACYHVALGSAQPPFSNLRDVALLSAGEWDLARLESTVARWRGTPVLARASHLLESQLGVESPVGLRSFTMSTAGRDMLEPYLVHGDRFPALAAATLRVLPLAERPAFALAVGLPEGARPAERARELWAGRPRRR